jgi:exopolyphosphatase/guanosine-5'-triphosphate,3'-diphosphate pyrophosphatase
VSKISVIDIGTNSVRILLCKIDNGKIINRIKKIRTTRLGEKVDKNNELTYRAIEETTMAIEEFFKLANEKGYKIKKIIGTSALRDANNSNLLIDDIKLKTGLDIDIIDGITEARFGYFGVINSFNFNNKNLVIDIGGGSTELIFGDKSVDLVDSLNIGAVRMTDRCVINEIPTEKELNCLKIEIDKVIDEFIFNNKINSFKNVIGIGGTITTLSAIKMQMNEYDSNLIQGSKFNKNELDKMISYLINLNINEKHNVDGLQPGRADIIVAGSIILERLFEKFNFTEIIVSDFDNLEGIIFKEIII